MALTDPNRKDTAHASREAVEKRTETGGENSADRHVNELADDMARRSSERLKRNEATNDIISK